MLFFLKEGAREADGGAEGEDHPVHSGGDEGVELGGEGDCVEDDDADEADEAGGSDSAEGAAFGQPLFSEDGEDGFIARGHGCRTSFRRGRSWRE